MFIQINAFQQLRFHNHIIHNAKASLALFFYTVQSNKKWLTICCIIHDPIFCWNLELLMFLYVWNHPDCKSTKTELQILMPTNDSPCNSGTIFANSTNAPDNNSLHTSLKRIQALVAQHTFQKECFTVWKIFNLDSC